ncbi:MAG TPA: hypothetical protein VKE40_19715 [Gemmataceae bacterium]|nr:hypothetical protein [Gemmataceae bacterium]
MIVSARLPIALALALAAVCGPAWGDPPGVRPPADALLPPGAVRQFGDIRFRHPGGIHGSALSPDGKWLATAASRSIMLWDTATGRPIRRFDPAPELRLALRSVSFSPDGSLLAATGRFADLFVWEAGSGKEVHRVLGPRDRRSESAGVVAFAPDGRQLILGTDSKTEIWDTRAWKVFRSVRDPGRLFSLVGPTLVNQGAFDGVYLSDPLAERPPVTLDAKAPPGGLALSPDGRTLAVFSVYGRIELWTIPEGRQVKSEELWGDVRSGLVAFAPDGKRLFLATPEGMTEWEVPALRLAGKFPSPPEARPTGFHLLPEGDSLLVCADDGVIWRYSRKTGKPLPGIPGYTTSVKAAAARDGRRLAVGDRSGRVEVWDTTAAKPADRVCESGGPVDRLAMSPDGETLVIGRSGALEVRDVRTHQIVGPGAKGVADIRTGGDSLPMVRLVEFGPDGRILVGTTTTSQLKVWDSATGDVKPVDTANGLGAFAPDGKALVCSIPDPGLVFLDPKTGSAQRRVKWPRESRDPLADRITAIAFAPDGRRLAVATDDGRFHLCDPATGEELAPFPPADPLAKPGTRGSIRVSAGVEAMAFSPDGGWLAAAGAGGGIRLWEVATRREAHRVAGHERAVTFVAFGPGGKTLLSAGDEGTVFQWDLRPPALPRDRSAWDDLAADDPAVAYRAVWALADDKAGAVRTLRAKLPPVAGPTPEELTRLIDRLNVDQFAAREAAMRALADLGPLAVPALRAAAAGMLSSEARERVTKLLAHNTDLTPPGLRAIRAVQVLELIGTPAAAMILKEWAAGAVGAPLTEEARRATDRLDRKR